MSGSMLMRSTSVVEVADDAGDGGEMEAGRGMRPLIALLALYSEFFSTFRGDCGCSSGKRLYGGPGIKEG